MTGMYLARLRVLFLQIQFCQLTGDIDASCKFLKKGVNRGSYINPEKISDGKILDVLFTYRKLVPNSRDLGLFRTNA